MYEVLSNAVPNSSRRWVGLYVLSSLGLVVLGMAFAHGVFTGMSQTVLGLILSAGFALLALALLGYVRVWYPHRVMLETDEELW